MLGLFLPLLAIISAMVLITFCMLLMCYKSNLFLNIDHIASYPAESFILNHLSNDLFFGYSADVVSFSNP